MSEQARPGAPATGSGETMSARSESIGVPGPGVAVAVLVALALFNFATGVFRPNALPDYAGSARQIIGMGLMTTLLPAYLIVATWFGQRRSFALLEALRSRLPDPAPIDGAGETLRGGLRATWVQGIVLGCFLALFNTQPVEALRGPLPVLEGAISFGQFALWIAVALLFGVRRKAAHAFRELARIVPIDLFRPETQRLIARSGVVDVAVVAGALLFTPLQSLDAEFRWYNYHFGLLVALPAAAFFLLWPITPLHRRNQVERDAQLAALDAKLDETLHGDGRTASEDGAIGRLETLLAHRDRIARVRTWPLSTGLLSRVFLYLVIPPLAWAAAAVVERFVDRLLG